MRRSMGSACLHSGCSVGNAERLNGLSSINLHLIRSAQHCAFRGRDDRGSVGGTGMRAQDRRLATALRRRAGRSPSPSRRGRRCVRGVKSRAGDAAGHRGTPETSGFSPVLRRFLASLAAPSPPLCRGPVCRWADFCLFAILASSVCAYVLAFAGHGALGMCPVSRFFIMRPSPSTTANWTFKVL